MTSCMTIIKPEQLRWEGTSVDCLVQPFCSKQGHLQQVAQGCVQSGSKYLQRWRLQNLSQCSTTPTVEKWVFLFRQNFLCFSFCLLPLLSLAFSAPPIWYLRMLLRSSWVLSFWGWTVLALSVSPCMWDAPCPILWTINNTEINYHLNTEAVFKYLLSEKPRLAKYTKQTIQNKNATVQKHLTQSLTNSWTPGNTWTD